MKILIKLFAVTFVILAGFSLASSVLAEGEEIATEIVATQSEIPTVEVISTTNISETTITINGHALSDGGSPILSAGFSWGKDLFTNAISTPGNLQSDGTFQETLSGLTCATTYHYGAFAINSIGTGITGTDLTFTTSDCSPLPQSPIVEILQTPTDISATSATLNGIIKQTGTTPITESGFNWGTTTNYGNTFSDTNAQAKYDTFSKALTNLICATTYHYNVFATNSIGTGTTSDSTFETAACPEVVPNTGPTTGGSNDNDASSTIIPNVVGSNDNENVVISNTPDAQSRSNGGGSSSSGSRIALASRNLITGDSADSCVIIATSLRKGSTGSEVVKLQELLNKFINSKLPLSGNYDESTVQVVKDFQNKYASEILAPWGVTEPSGIVSFTTLKKLNELSCSQEFPLSSVEQYLIDQYKANPASVGTQSTTTPIEVGTNTITPPEGNTTQTAGVANSEVSNSIFKKIANFFKNIF